MEVSNENVSKDKEESPQLNNNSKEPPASQQDATKKSKKEDRNRKEDKSLDQFMKSLNSIPSADDKLAEVCKRYIQAADENKKLNFYKKQSDKRYTLLSKDKDQLQLEFNKTVLVKSKLENLCRELQKQNKAVKEESLLRIREEEERRKETQAKFQSTLSEITTLLQQNNEKNVKLRDDNLSMSEKFKNVVQQYQLREQQVDKMAKQLTLESQLSDAKLEKANLEHQAEKERLKAEMEQMKMEVAQCRAKIMELQGTETALRGQLAVYTDKYDEFQSALLKSNQVFGGFKTEMEKMTKKITQLEKENALWRKRWERSQAALIESCSERQNSVQKTAHAQRQLEHMQGLCRTLQAERTVLLNTLKENNIERPPLPAVTPAPPPPPPAPSADNNNKVDAMAANCAQLRQSLAHLQNQLNVLTNQKQENEQPRQEKAKKSKSKKNKDKTNQQEPKTDTLDETQTETAAEIDKTNPEGKLVEEINSEEANIEEINTANDGEIVLDNDETMENLIEAISQANISLCDLECAAEENKMEGENVASNNKTNTPIVDANLNEEVSHIVEVKPIAEEKIV